ncbi:hypothetical protein Pmani_022054 [Petrolisthes manimaculis]|uniref:Uncharacterized protein n=1 Tax=Petrolisthes manimaculis TaxID=1843537 RepID=A0AAE1PEY3_9EUCA|nr:hypothetical protein Pmani_022054 [Petrolisthes manimaculis]
MSVTFVTDENLENLLPCEPNIIRENQTDKRRDNDGRDANTRLQNEEGLEFEKGGEGGRTDSFHFSYPPTSTHPNPSTIPTRLDSSTSTHTCSSTYRPLPLSSVHHTNYVLSSLPTSSILRISLSSTHNTNYPTFLHPPQPCHPL